MKQTEIRKKIHSLKMEIASLEKMLIVDVDFDARASKAEQVWLDYPAFRRTGIRKDVFINKIAQLDMLEIERIHGDILARKEGDAQWFAGYIPQISTYVNQRRWESAITPLHPLVRLGVIVKQEDIVSGFADQVLRNASLEDIGKIVHDMVENGLRPYLYAVGESVFKKAKKQDKHGIVSGFERFKMAYPVKSRMMSAEITWKKQGLDEYIEKIIIDIQKRLTHDQAWKSGFIMNANNYLIERLWDEVEPIGIHERNEQVLREFIMNNQDMQNQEDINRTKILT